MPIGIWKATDGEKQPTRLRAAPLDLERRLQDWIAADPAIVEDGLTVVGVEVHLDRQRRVDILAFDPNQRLVVVELKAVKLTRDVVAQTLDYIARLQSMSRAEMEGIASRLTGPLPESALDPDTRVVVGIAVGIGERDDLTRITEYLGERNVPIRHLSFDIFESAGDLLLVRQVARTPAEPRGTGSRAPLRAVSIDELVAAPAFEPIRGAVDRLVGATEAVGLHRRVYKSSVMFAPPQFKTRMLITLSVEGTRAVLYVSADTFNEFYGTPVSDIHSVFEDVRSNELSITSYGGQKLVVTDGAILERIADALPSWTLAVGTDQA